MQRRLPRVREADERGVGEELRARAGATAPRRTHPARRSSAPGACSTGSARCRVRLPAAAASQRRRAARGRRAARRRGRTPPCPRARRRRDRRRPHRVALSRTVGARAGLAVRVVTEREQRGDVAIGGSQTSPPRHRRRRRARRAARAPRGGTRHSRRRRRRPSHCTARRRRSRTPGTGYGARPGAPSVLPTIERCSGPGARSRLSSSRWSRCPGSWRAVLEADHSSRPGRDHHRPPRPAVTAPRHREPADVRIISFTGRRTPVHCNAPTQVELHWVTQPRRDGGACGSTADRCSRPTPADERPAGPAGLRRQRADAIVRDRGGPNGQTRQRSRCGRRARMRNPS